MSLFGKASFSLKRLNILYVVYPLLSYFDQNIWGRVSIIDGGLEILKIETNSDGTECFVVKSDGG